MPAAQDPPAPGQEVPVVRELNPVPESMTAAEARVCLERALAFLMRTQAEDGHWGTGGIEGLVFGIILAIVVALFGSIILFGFELVVVLVLLVPLLALLRFFWVLPWVVEATHGNELLGVEKVRGWRDSEERIRDIAAAYQRGEDPFLGRRIP